MKKIIALTLSLLFCLSLIGCGGNYVDNVTSSEITDILEKSVPTDGGYVEAESDFITFNLKDTESLFLDCKIILAVESGSNANEIGVFRAKDKKAAKKISETCNDYLVKKAEHWNYDYNPSENVKIENSDVKVFGTYVVYTVLTPSDSELAFVAVENLLATK